jgi:hypothetical protein
LCNQITHAAGLDGVIEFQGGHDFVRALNQGGFGWWRLIPRQQCDRSGQKENQEGRQQVEAHGQETAEGVRGYAEVRMTEKVYKKGPD